MQRLDRLRETGFYAPNFMLHMQQKVGMGHPRAEADLQEIKRCYEEQRQGLGIEMMHAVRGGNPLRAGVRLLAQHRLRDRRLR